MLPGWVGQSIDLFLNGKTPARTGGISLTFPDGTSRNVSQEEMVGMILDEFYNTVQFVIGEATDVSELKGFLKDKEKEL